MFGFSISKLALLMIVVGIVVIGFRLYTKGRATTGREGGIPAPEETRPCKTCGSFVAASLARPCGRADCPFGA